MSKDVQFDQDKFDAVLKRLINTPPITFKDAVAVPKLKKDGTPKRKKTFQKMDKP